MFDLLRESAILGVIGSVGATTAILIFNIVRAYFA
jgi:5,10-methylene-tetrahydrofolate dehydrogenase/methenyl tetrahydrofolate cyclohydrolase